MLSIDIIRSFSSELTFLAVVQVLAPRLGKALCVKDGQPFRGLAVDLCERLQVLVVLPNHRTGRGRSLSSCICTMSSSGIMFEFKF